MHWNHLESSWTHPKLSSDIRHIDLSARRFLSELETTSGSDWPVTMVLTLFRDLKHQNDTAIPTCLWFTSSWFTKRGSLHCLNSGLFWSCNSFIEMASRASKNNSNTFFNDTDGQALTTSLLHILRVKIQIGHFDIAQKLRSCFQKLAEMWSKRQDKWKTHAITSR